MNALVETRIVNIVMTADLKQPVDIIASGKMKYFTYDSEKYRGRVAYFKSADVIGKVSIFSSGKMISVGSKNPHDAFRNLELAAESLLNDGIINSAPVLETLVASFPS